MEVGIHPFIWTAKWDESSLPLINKAKEMGFDFIEVPLVKTDISLARKVRKQLRLAGINCCSTTTGLNQNTDLTSNNANIRLNGIKHLKICENDRGIPGSGHCDWDGVFKALSEIGYNKTASIESFVSTIPERAAATCIWRKLAPNGDVLAQEGLRFLRDKIKKYKL